MSGWLVGLRVEKKRFHFYANVVGEVLYLVLGLPSPPPPQLYFHFKWRFFWQRYVPEMK